jgi:hypothetical protein
MSAVCKECEEIATEYRDAFLNFWRNSTENTRAACRATANLVSCREDDAIDAQQHLRPFTPDELTRPPNEFQARILGAVSRKCLHQHGTGHRVILLGS